MSRASGSASLSKSVVAVNSPVAETFTRVVGFTDFGTVDLDASLDKFRLSVGAGLRITVPGMGPVPIALDWAVPVVRQDFDRDQLFSFYIGINR